MSIVDRCGSVQPHAAMVMFVVVRGEERVTERPRVLDRPEPGRERRLVFDVLNAASEKGLSFDTCGRECDRTTCRSARRSAIFFDVIEVPRSACTTRGTPWVANTSAMNPGSLRCRITPLTSDLVKNSGKAPTAHPASSENGQRQAVDLVGLAPADR